MASALLHLHHLWGYEIDWGAIPTWFGAILTGGSLLLGFYLLLRVRRKEERAQIDKVMVWLERRKVDFDGNVPDPAWRMLVQNWSGASLIRIHVAAIPTHRRDSPKVISGEGTP